MLNVMILFGGQSTEHEVSRVSAKNVLDNIDCKKYNIITVGITKNGRWLLYDGPLLNLEDGSWQKIAEDSFLNKCNDVLQSLDICQSPKDFLLSFAKRVGLDKIDVVFPAMHGINCEDGSLQGFLQLCDVPYVGSGVLGSSMSMDKEISKLVFEKAGIPQGKYFTVNRSYFDIDQVYNRVEKEIGFPCFVKPANAGSSVGVSKAGDKVGLNSAILEASRFDRKILIEEYINGREIECAVMGNDEPVSSPVGEIVPSNDFYDYNAKYIDNASTQVIPAQIPEQTSMKIQKYAIEAYKALNCSGLSRVDFFVEKTNGDIYINEINTLPGFTSISMYPVLWAHSGLSYSKLIDKLLEFAIERHCYGAREI